MRYLVRTEVSEILARSYIFRNAFRRRSFTVPDTTFPQYSDFNFVILNYVLVEVIEEAQVLACSV